MRQNFKGDKRRKEEARKKKQEEKRYRRLHKKDSDVLTEEGTPSSLPETVQQNTPFNG